MIREETMRVLVTVKAYPGLSVRRGETVCVAGARLDAESPTWVRLYPVQFRDLPFAQQFKKYQFVDLRARKSTDPRPESYSPNLHSLALGDALSTSGDRTWSKRWQDLDALAGATTTCALLAAQDHDGPQPSLGLIKPVVDDLVVEENEAFDVEKTALAEMAASENLFGAARTPLEPAPFRLRYHYRCAEDGCRGHKPLNIDWEAGEAARRWRAEGRSDQELKRLLREKFLDQLCGPGRDSYFYVGNQFAHPKGFLVLGVFWPPAGSRPEAGLF